MSPDKLVYMANQIARAFAPEGDQKATADTATHIRKFWDPRMRMAIFAHLDQGGAGLDPISLKALRQLQAAAAPH